MLRRRQITRIDADTGEVLDGVWVYMPRPKKSAFGRRFFMASQDAFHMIGCDPDFTGETYRVLWLLLAKLDFENYICVSQQQIGQDLSMQKQNVSRAVQLLLRKEIINEGPRASRTKSYRLNPNIGWKGKAAKQQRAITDNVIYAKFPSKSAQQVGE